MAEIYEFTPITPTEPIPETAGSPMTYEQGEKAIQMLTDVKQMTMTTNDTLVGINKTLGGINDTLVGFKDSVTSKFDTAIQLLTDIKTNTVPVAYDPSNPTGITYEQADKIINLLHDGLHMFGYALGAVFIWFVIRQVYRFFGGVIFGGV